MDILIQGVLFWKNMTIFLSASDKDQKFSQIRLQAMEKQF